jgi:hypothetical protein
MVFLQLGKDGLECLCFGASLLGLLPNKVRQSVCFGLSNKVCHGLCFFGLLFTGNLFPFHAFG